LVFVGGKGVQKEDRNLKALRKFLQTVEAASGGWGGEEYEVGLGRIIKRGTGKDEGSKGCVPKESFPNPRVREWWGKRKKVLGGRVRGKKNGREERKRKSNPHFLLS